MAEHKYYGVWNLHILMRWDCLPGIRNIRLKHQMIIRPYALVPLFVEKLDFSQISTLIDVWDMTLWIGVEAYKQPSLTYIACLCNQLMDWRCISLYVVLENDQ